MITIEPTIRIYDDEGNLSKAYDKAVDKMIDKTYDIDLEQFDFDEVAKGKSKELDNLVAKLCKESGLGSKDIYTMFLDRFEAEYDVPVDFVVYLGKDWEDDFEESKKSVTKSIKESINGDCYIYYDDDDGKRNVFCDYVKGITDTRSWFYLNEYIIDAIHIFKNEKQAQKFIDEHLKYFADQDKVVIAEYPQTVGGFFESKESARKSIKESSVRVVTFEQIVDSRFEDISKGEKILNDRKDEIVELCGDDFSVYTKNIEFLDWGDNESQYRQRYYIRKNNNVTWNDLYKIVNSVKAVPYKFDKINEFVFESKKSATKSIKESADDNWYKLKMLNEMLDAMEEDEYNIPKLVIYGVTKNISLDKGAIEALIKYYK